MVKNAKPSSPHHKEMQSVAVLFVNLSLFLSLPLSKYSHNSYQYIFTYILTRPLYEKLTYGVCKGFSLQTTV